MKIAKITLCQLPARHVVSVRKTIDFFTEYGPLMGEALTAINTLIERQEIFPSSGPIVCFHNVDLKALDVEISLQVPVEVPGSELVESKVLPAQTVVRTIDCGAYEKQDSTLEALLKWVPTNNYRAAGGIYYHYLNEERQKPDECLTEMYVPVEKST
ncbi:transcriptional regulator [Enterococcus florum]|uniref:Transcriptional regulator n=1 Tax=Enterococcus florum TaxID=2480627 RepID=A0A4P5PFG8_9ENTE|nr:GyrI-like domain-containing protein [Enterococcus florum]GCF94372.1 transcriptional regulator [Enterococcus florum]